MLLKDFFSRPFAFLFAQFSLAFISFIFTNSINTNHILFFEWGIVFTLFLTVKYSSFKEIIFTNKLGYIHATGVIVFLIATILLSLDYKHYVDNSAIYLHCLIVISVVIVYKNNILNLIISTFVLILLFLSGQRELMMLFIFLKIAYSILSNRQYSVLSVAVLCIAVSITSIAQYTIRTNDSDFSKTEFVTSVERTIKRVAFPVYVSNTVLSAEDIEPKPFFDYALDTFLPSFLGGKQLQLDFGGDLQRSYFDHNSTIRLPATFSGQFYHFFGGSVTKTLYLMLVYITFVYAFFVLGKKLDHISIPVFILFSFYFARLEHIIFLISNVKWFVLFVGLLVVLKYLKVARDVKNLTY